MKERVIIAMSGGVDSSTAAAILKEQGYDVIGISMKIWDYSQEETDRFGTCCSMDDIAEARRVAELIGIPFYVLDLENEFKREVVDYFVKEYMAGKTPNPCIPCNKKLKFSSLMRYADKIDASKVATGHYASVEKIDDRYVIKRGKDRLKDQSYYLFNLSQAQLKRSLFPLGEMTKREVRDEARRFGLRVAEKEESQEICFIPDNDYRSFITNRVGKDKITEGEIVSENGDVLGKHSGFHHYTVGQRKGLGIALGSPLYVSKIDPLKNRITVSDSEGLKKSHFLIKDVNWAIPPAEDSIIHTTIQIRSRHTPGKATLKIENDGLVEATFAVPQNAISPGQAAVFYDGDLIRGGGWIVSGNKGIRN